MKASELRLKTIDELRKLLETQKIEIEKLMLSLIQKKEKNVNKAKIFRADIARINSVINEKKIISEGVDQ